MPIAQDTPTCTINEDILITEWDGTTATITARFYGDQCIIRYKDGLCHQMGKEAFLALQPLMFVDWVQGCYMGTWVRMHWPIR